MNDGTPGMDAQESPRLRQLRWLVTTLTLTLIVGVITVVGLLVIRLGQISPPPDLPATIRLPEGERALAMTMGSDWVGLVTVDKVGTERIRVIDVASGLERGVTLVAPR